MNVSAYLGGALIALASLVIFLLAPVWGMPPEPVWVLRILCAIVGIIGLIAFANEICMAVCGRSIFG